MSRLLSVLVTSLVLVAPLAVRAAESHVAFDSNVKVSVLSKDGPSAEQVYESGKPIPLKNDQVYWVTATGKVPVLVVPQSSNDPSSPAKVAMPDVAVWPSEIANQQLQSKLSTIVDELYQFQSALARKDTTEAEKVLNRMEATQPMDYYAFLRGSLAFVKGDLKQARDQVQKGLKRYPANEQGARLLKTIEGVSK